MRSTFVCARSKLSPLVHKPTSSPPSLWLYPSSTGWSCAPQDQKICLRRIQREPSRYLITRPSRWSAPAKSARYRSPTPANSLLPQRLSQVPKFGHHSAEIRRRSPGLSAAKSEKAFGAPSDFADARKENRAQSRRTRRARRTAALPILRIRLKSGPGSFVATLRRRLYLVL